MFNLNNMKGFESTSQGEPVEKEAEINPEKQKAIEYFRRAFNDQNTEVQLAIPLLLRDISIARKTDGETLSVAVEGCFSQVEKQSFAGRNVSDRRALDSLNAIVNHENSLVGNNLTVAEAKEILAH